MGILVRDSIASGTWPGEQEVVLSQKGDDGKARGIVIHPWNRRTHGWDSADVFVELGDIKKNGSRRKNGDTAVEIFNREDFVEALLAVFPELKRA